MHTLTKGQIQHVIKWCEEYAKRYLKKSHTYLRYANHLETNGLLDAARAQRKRAYRWAQEATLCYSDARYYRDNLVTLSSNEGLDSRE